MDGAQARLKWVQRRCQVEALGRGKGGWGSGEIETIHAVVEPVDEIRVERVDGAQARLKLDPGTWHCQTDCSGKGGWGSGEIETS